MEGVVVLNVVLLALALTGLAATARRDAARWLPTAVAVYLWLAYSSIIVNSRYSLPVMPVVALYAGGGAVWMRGLWVRQGCVSA